MTSKAIEVLNQDKDGFFLMVEGGAIDWLAHNRDPAGVVADTFEFDKAVGVALDFAKKDCNTLVLVTADHETGALEIDEKDVNTEYINGITATTEFMWGLIESGEMDYASAMSSYANIPKLTKIEKECIELYGEGGISDVISARANVEWGWSGMDNGDHTDTLVPVYAFGPNSNRFGGELDNTEIGQLMFISISGSW
jgi:alkaline phosphatase